MISGIFLFLFCFFELELLQFVFRHNQNILPENSQLFLEKYYFMGLYGVRYISKKHSDAFEAFGDVYIFIDTYVFFIFIKIYQFQTTFFWTPSIKSHKKRWTDKPHTRKYFKSCYKPIKLISDIAQKFPIDLLPIIKE